MRTDDSYTHYDQCGSATQVIGTGTGNQSVNFFLLRDFYASFEADIFFKKYDYLFFTGILSQFFSSGQLVAA